jgi:uncharacterized protein
MRTSVHTGCAKATCPTHNLSISRTKPFNQPDHKVTISRCRRSSTRALPSVRSRPHSATRLEPWHTNRLSRLVKTPKLHLGDSGLAATLLDAGSDTLLDDRKLFGKLLETFVFQGLNRAAGWRDDAPRFFHFRDRDGIEVDIVIELGARAVAGVEVKAGATVIESDFSGLRKLQLAAGKRFRRGVVLYDGEAVMPFGERLQAVPIRLLWEAA